MIQSSNKNFRFLKLLFLANMFHSMEDVRLVCLSGGRAIVNERVFTIQPKIFLTSSILPLALNIFKDMVSVRGIGSFLFRGREIECIANGIAALTLYALSMSEQLQLNIQCICQLCQYCLEVFGLLEIWADEKESQLEDLVVLLRWMKS
jgi:hypothetical protein